MTIARTGTKTLAAAIVRAQALAVAVEKTSANHHQRYNYASAESIMQTATECLAAAGLALLCKSWEVRPLEGRSDGHFADVVASFELLHEGGESREIGPFAMPAISARGRPQDKAISTALTYLQGYGLRGVLNLPRVDEGSEVDARDDGQRAAKQQPAAQSRPAQAAQSATPGADGRDREKYLKEWRQAWQAACGLHGVDVVVRQAIKMGAMTNERGKGLSLHKIKEIMAALDQQRRPDPRPDPRSGTRGGGNRSNSA